jgi:CBS domain-containing protein
MSHLLYVRAHPELAKQLPHEARRTAGQRRCWRDDAEEAGRPIACLFVSMKRMTSIYVTSVAKEMHMEQLKDVMSRGVQVISPDSTIREAARKMREGDFGMMPVGENDRMIGAITDRDIAIRAVAEGKDPDTRVRDVMSEDIVWAYEDASVEEAAELMSEHQIRRLPIVNRDKRLVGIVALGDFAVEASDIEPAAEALTEISQPS